MNLRQLQYFKTIAELEHYTRAAEKLYVSQSNLSHSIQELEDELNVEFFVRKGRNIKLTKYGELFLPYVSQALNLLDTGVARLQDYINPNSGTVVMACFPSLAEFAPELIVRYLSETNRVGVRLQFNQEATFMQLRDKLLAGEIDLLFCTKSTTPGWKGPSSVSTRSSCWSRRATGWLSGSRWTCGSWTGSPSSLSTTTASCAPSPTSCSGAWASSPRLPWRQPRTSLCTAWWPPITASLCSQALGGTPYNVKVLPIENEIPARKLYIQWNKEQYMPPAAEYFRDFIIRSGLIFNHFLERHNLKEGS